MSRAETAALDRFAAELAPGLLTPASEVEPRFHHDWSDQDPVVPLALARPRNSAEVSAVLAAATRHGVAIVPQGGLTGLAGGAHPSAGSVALSLERMAGVEAIDEVGSTLTVMAGTPLAVVQQAAEAVGLQYPVDLGARGSCTIGGNLSTNAGGVRVIRYGMTRENVLGLEFVLPDGTVVDALNTMLKNNAGYDLKQLMIGAEGTLGVITRAVLRLQPKPTTVATALCAMADFSAATELLKALRRRLGPALTVFEAMWPNFHDFMADNLPLARKPFARTHGTYVLVEASGFGDEAVGDRLEAALGDLLEAGVLEDVVVAASERDARDLWTVRESVSEYGRILGRILGYDLGVPIPVMGDLVDALTPAIREKFPDARVLCYGHVGDSNLHVVVNVPSAGRHQPHDAVDAIVFPLTRGFGGTISAEHGIGTLKKPYMHLARTPEALDLMRRLKRALDPSGLLNPGKLLPDG